MKVRELSLVADPEVEDHFLCALKECEFELIGAVFFELKQATGIE